MFHCSMSQNLSRPVSRAMRAVWSLRSSLPMRARSMKGSSWSFSRVPSTWAARSKSPLDTAPVISNTWASSTGAATASMSALVMRSPLA